MKKISFKVIALVVLVVMTIPTTSNCQNNQYSFTGKVTNKSNHKHLSGVNISVAGSRKGTVTNEKGEFNIKLEKLPAVLYFSHIGYGIQVIQIDQSSPKHINVQLQPEIIEFNEITISGEAIQKVTKGDSLFVVDYELLGSNMLLVAHPYKRPRLQRLYLATLSGDIISYREIKSAGKNIHYPEKPFPIKSYFFKDCFNQIHLFTKDRVWQIFIRNGQIFCLYPTQYEDFLGFLFPMKFEINGNLFYQVSTRMDNETCLIKTEGEKLTLKVVHDPFGASRYMFARNVSAPIIKKDSLVVIFDFFDNHIEIFNFAGISQTKVSIDFHLKKVIPFLQKEYYDLDHLNFQQKILFDEITGLSYAVWRNKKSGRYSLQKIDVTTGRISEVIEIPGFPNISKIRCTNNSVYFMYVTKNYPYYQTIFRMRM